MRKDLKAAFELAVEQHPIDYYKNILQKFQEELIAQEEARKEAEAAKEAAKKEAAAATPKKAKKGKGKVGEDGDVSMVDADASAKKTKKRKAEDETSVSHPGRRIVLTLAVTNVTDAMQTPQRSDSAKKPKIKLNTSSTPKAANGASAPKGAGDAAKATKPKATKAKEGDKKAESKESKMTPEERHQRKVVRDITVFAIDYYDLSNYYYRRRCCFYDTSSKRGFSPKSRLRTPTKWKPCRATLRIWKNFPSLRVPSCGQPRSTRF